jgi:hypothetical protein
MPDSPLLDSQPPIAGRLAITSLEALMERSKVPFGNVRIFWVLMGVGEGYGEDLTLVGPQSGAVYRGETPEQRLT